MIPITIKASDQPADGSYEAAAAECAGGHHLLFPPLPYDLHARASEALNNAQLQQFVNRTTLLKDTSRRKALSDTFGVRADTIRRLAGQIRQHTLDHLDYYLEMFIDRAGAAGAQVHFAIDAAQAREVCVHIARQNGCKLCVKSKSMVTEEIQLLGHLQAMGCEVVETDLGEFILQLDGDAPSHIVTPMIHKDRAAAGRVFERKLGAAYTEDPARLTQIARTYLRQKYRRADLGITGGNFLVASTGSLVLCTNEGNARFCAGAPPVHIAVVGIEKVVPDLNHLSVLLKLLARSSTGQPLTVYTQVITGPRRGGENDGPRQLHIVLIDNGRTAALKQPTREILRCIRCGACLNACPVYRKIGGHAYGGVYSGPIGAVLTPLLQGLQNFPDLPRASSLCGACYHACPVQINIPELLIQLRQELAKHRSGGLPDRLMYRLWAWILGHPPAYRLGAWMVRRLLRWRADGGSRNGDANTKPPHQRGDPYSTPQWVGEWVGRLPGPLGAWMADRDMPAPAPRSFRQWWNGR